MTYRPTQPIDEAVRDLLTDTQGEVEADTSYRPVLTGALVVLGYEEEEIQQALNKLYKVN